jgi:ribonuclease G
MSAEILINVAPYEVRAAVVEQGALQEILIERASRKGLLGNIYKGKVTRVLPGMQAAFLDIGLERTAFLHTSDVFLPRAPDGTIPEIPIRELLHEGEELVVQVLKDPLGTKGARLTTNITIPSRYLVLLPKSTGCGISSRITDEFERERLKGIVTAIVPADAAYGVILRTAAEGATAEALAADLDFLRKLWDVIRADAIRLPAGRVVHQDLPLESRVLRDLVHPLVERVRVDSADAYARLRTFAEVFMPRLAPMIELHTEDRPLFDLYGIEDDIQKALARTVALRSGGYVVIEQTEAMTTIDVNTGGYVGHSTLEDTIFRTNVEAAAVIARQLRVRNLGGIIIIDFIDMQDEAHRRQVLEALQAALNLDHAHTQIMQVSPLGLVEMTRKRSRESLEHILCVACPACEGRGFVKTAETVCYEIFRHILRQHRRQPAKELVVLAQPDVVEMLLDEQAAGLAEVAGIAGKPIRLQTEANYLIDQFDVVAM